MNILKHSENAVILEETSKLFFAKSINAITIKDIATHLGIGEATIYRRFSNKFNLVLAVGQHLQDVVIHKYLNIDVNLTGYEQIEKFFNCYLDIFVNEPEYYKFINEFDNYIVENEGADLKEYEKGIDAFRIAFMHAYAKGLEDKTIKEIDDIESFYYATTIGVMSLCKKLASKDVLNQDAKLNKANQIKVLIDTILYRIK